jgi:hypothetical protein
LTTENNYLQLPVVLDALANRQTCMFVQKVTEQGEVAEADVWLKGSLQKPIKPADDDTLFRPVGEYFANISSSPDTFSEEIYSTGRLFFLYFNLDGGLSEFCPK